MHSECAAQHLLPNRALKNLIDATALLEQRLS